MLDFVTRWNIFPGFFEQAKHKAIEKFESELWSTITSQVTTLSIKLIHIVHGPQMLKTNTL